ncbi:MAG TPA: SUMF1/EgtB/PvdO family nonheme iron enzyme [Candidatus Binatia bacterium]|nr:SUMF1/EgtB/PvdO family nonheme iron enzyme [Candidatus Binatia bacterium]
MQTMVTAARTLAAAIVSLSFTAGACENARRASDPSPAGPGSSAPSATPSSPVEASAPAAGAPDRSTSTVPSPCPPSTTLVEGSYCNDLRHWCLEGYPSIGAPWTKYYPGGALGVTYCEKYVVGKTECRGGERPLRFCIDTYEHPGKGEKPTVMVSWLDADRLCKARSERLCNDDEWTLACEGPERTPYPYGWERDETACNIGKDLPPHRSNEKIYSKDPAVSQAELDRLDLRVPSGSMPRCVSPFGVYDMTGNADEWCRSVTNKAASMTRAPFVSVFKGGHMLGKVRNRCRPETNAHGPEFYYHVEGFRCCADVRAQ